MLWRRLITVICLVTCAITWMPTSANTCGIEYEIKTVDYQKQAILDCGLSSPHKWWRSDSQCDNFTGYTCSSTSRCILTINESIGRHLYYCCTGSTVTDVVSVVDAQRQCFKIQVCTNTSMNTQGGTIAFFNEPVQIFINMTSEPPPNQSLVVSLTQNSTSRVLHDTFDSVNRVGNGFHLVWQYIVQVPDLNSMTDNGKLMFSVTYEHETESCQISQNKIMYTIPVLRRIGSAPPTSSVCVTDKPTTECHVTSSTDHGASLVALGVPLGVLLLISLVFNAVIFVCCLHVLCYRKRHQSSPYDNYPSSGRNYGIHTGPGTTPLVTPSQVPSPATPQSHLSRDSMHTHPLTLAARGELPSNGVPTTAEHHNSNGPSTPHTPTPTPSAQQRLLPGLPADASVNQAPANNVMETIHEEREGERNDAVLYEHLVEPVTLSERQTDSGTVKV